MLLAVGTLCVALWRPTALSEDPDRRRGIVLVSSLVVFMIVLHVFGLPLPRYNLPFKPLEFGLAMVGVAAGWEWLRRRWAIRMYSDESGRLKPPYSSN